MEAVRSMGFMRAAEEAFDAMHEKEVLPAKRHISLNSRGGVFEVADATSEYRRSVRRQGRLLVLWLWCAILMCAINAYELIVPNILEVQELLDDTSAVRNLVMRQTDFLKAASFMMAFFELIGFGFLCIGITWSAFLSTFRDGFRRWHSLSQLAWIWVPLLTRFSAIKMLGRCHPKTVFTDVVDLLEAHGKVSEDDSASCPFLPILSRWQMLLLLRMVAMKLVVLLAGLAALLIKAHKLSELLSREERTFLGVAVQGLGIIGYVNQCLNIVDVEGVLKREALRFAFAGEDATYQRKELVYKRVFAASVAKGIMEHVGKERGRVFAFAALYTFDHKDIQRLALSSEDVKRCWVVPQKEVDETPA